MATSTSYTVYPSSSPIEMVARPHTDCAPVSSCGTAHGTFYRHWFGVQVCAGDSTNAEWLAKIALMLVLGKWPGTVILATDSTTSPVAKLPRSPPAASLVSVLFRAAITQLRARPLETWLPA